MKGRIFLAIAFFLFAGIVFYIGAQLNSGGNPLSRASKPGDMVQDSLSIVGVSQLVSEGICDVEVLQSDREVMTVSYDATESTNNSTVVGSKLHINFGIEKVGFFDFSMRPDVKVKIYTTHLDTLINIGTGHITGGDTVAREGLYVLNEGVGSIDYTTRAKSVVAKNRGVGALDLFGFAEELFVLNEGVGSVNTNKLIALNVRARNSGIGSVEVYASDSLDIANEGIGSLKYSGSGKVYRERNEGIGSISRGK